MKVPKKRGKRPRAARQRRHKEGDLWLEAIPPADRPGAVAAFNERNLDGFLRFAPPTSAMGLVAENQQALVDCGLYEKGLLIAYSEAQTGRYSQEYLVGLFEAGDPAKLRAAGDPLPNQASFTLYRGVRGYSDEGRVVRGLSWTDSVLIASWFAWWRKWPDDELIDPAVYRATVPRAAVVAFTTARGEREFLTRGPWRNVRRVRNPPRAKICEPCKVVKRDALICAACGGLGFVRVDDGGVT